MDRVKQLPTVRNFAVSLILFFCAAIALGRTHPSKQASTDKVVPVPAFSISVKLSDAAQIKLQSIHETVRVIAYFDGDALPGQGKFNAPFRDVFLGGDEKIVDENLVAAFDSTMISQENWNRLANKDYFVTINVVSARRASKNNLLFCDVPEKRMSTFTGNTTQVFCRLIEEQFPTTQKY